MDIPTVSGALRRMERELVRLGNPRDRIMLEVYRDHWLAEVRNDVDAVMATIPEGPVSYRFDGIGLMIPDYLEIAHSEGARQLYQGAANRDLPMAGPFEEERWSFADWGMAFEGINVAIVRGASLHGQPEPLDPEGLYLARWRSASTHPIDVERRLMLGEHVYTGALISLDTVDMSAVERMLS